MEQTNYLRDFIKYTFFNVLGMLGLSGYILADTFFVSKGLGADGLTALNLAIPVYSFIHGSGLMLGMGGAIRYAVCKSQGEKERADRVFTGTVAAAVVFAAAFVLLGGFFSGQITTLMGATPEIYDMTNTYLKVILLFSPAFLMNDVCISFVRNDGNPRLSMTAMLSGSFANIILDYIFIFPLKLGIFGAVLATGIAPVLSMGILSTHKLKKNNGFHFTRERGGIRELKSILPLGVPSLVTELSSGIVIIVFNKLLLGLMGNIGVAAYGIVANLSLVAAAVYTGIAQGMQPLVSRAYGSGDGGSQKKLLHYAWLTQLVISGVLYLFLYFCADPVASVFNSEGNRMLQQTAVEGLRLYFTGAAFMGFNIVTAVFFSATERALPAQLVSLLRGLILIVPMAFLLSVWMKVPGVWLSLPVTECIVALLGWIMVKKACNSPKKMV